MEQVPLILTKTQNHVRPRATSNHRCKPMVPPKGAALGSARHPCEARGGTRGLTGISRPFTRTDGVGTGHSTSPPPAHVLPQPLPLQQHVSCQNKPLGEGTAEVEPSARATPATNAKHTLRALPGTHHSWGRPPQSGRGSQASGCPLPEPGGWEAASKAVAGTGPAGCKQRPSGRPRRSGARSPRPPRHPPWLLGARALLPRMTAVRGQTRGLGEPNRALSPLAPASQEESRGEAGEALRLPRGDVAPSADPGPSPQPATPSRGMDTHRARRGDKRRRTATE